VQSQVYYASIDAEVQDKTFTFRERPNWSEVQGYMTTLRLYSPYVVPTTVIVIIVFLSMARWNESKRTYNEVSYVNFSADGKNLAVVRLSAEDAGIRGKHFFANVSRTIAVLDTARLSESVVIQRNIRKGFQGSIDRHKQDMPLVFSPGQDRIHVLEWGGGRVQTWDIAARCWTNDVFAEGIDAKAFSLSPNGEILAVAQPDGVVVWNIRVRQPLFSGTFGRSMRFSPDSKHLAISGRDNVEIWNVREPRLVAKLREIDGTAFRYRDTCMAFSPNGENIALRCKAGLYVYNIATGAMQPVLPEYLEVHKRNGGWLGHTEIVGDETRGVTYSPDGRLLAAWGNYGLKLFDTLVGCNLWRSDTGRAVSSFAFSPDGKTYATGDHRGKVTISDIVSGKKIRSTVLK
jgi:WD40 repeat protein